MSKNFVFKNSVYAIAILVLVLFFLAETGCSSQGHLIKRITSASSYLLPATNCYPLG